MKLFFLFLLSSCTIGKTTQSSFIDKVLNDFNKYSHFVSIKSIDSNIYVVENDDLYYFLKEKKSFSKKRYRKEIRSKLIAQSSIDIVSPNEDFIKVMNLPSVSDNAKKGIDDFIEIYFDNKKTLKDGITDNERATIINQLFIWKIACKIDDETGYLMISK